MTLHKSCRFYNWGGKAEYPSYPRAYGARCEYHREFFFKDRDDKTIPDCSKCEKRKEVSQDDTSGLR